MQFDRALALQQLLIKMVMMVTVMTVMGLVMRERKGCHAMPGVVSRFDIKISKVLPIARGMRGPQMEIGLMVTDRPPF